MTDGVPDARKRLCQAVDDWSYSDDDESLLDSEVSELLRSQSPGLVVASDRSPYKRLRQPDAAPVVAAAAVTSQSAVRPIHAGPVASLPRPSLDFYKMQVCCFYLAYMYNKKFFRL